MKLSDSTFIESSYCSGTAALPESLSIRLTAQEETLFQLLLDAASKQGLGTVLRVAGGWVRDKVLGCPSDDIDIALDNQSGMQFATAVNDLLESRGEATHTVAVIQANPEQSKHLETATVKVLGFEIDFVNLRAETYSGKFLLPRCRLSLLQ